MTLIFEPMRFIYRIETDPYFNLAAEEFILKNSTEDVFMLWRNSPAVIIGKHQNAFAEVNHSFIKERNIAVIRRITGGGAVYHDHGNVNFSFVSHGEPEHLVDFHKFTRPVIQALQELGTEVTSGNRNSLYINGYKISGNAEHVYKNKVLHHGTLLFSSELDVLDNAIKPPATDISDKAVKSIRSKVANIAGLIDNQISVEDFAVYMFTRMQSLMPNANVKPFTESELAGIEELRKSKYIHWHWNYGYSPRFSFPAVITVNESAMNVDIHINGGSIEKLELRDRYNQTSVFNKVAALLHGTAFIESEIRDRLNGLITSDGLDQFISSLPVVETAEHLPELNV